MSYRLSFLLSLEVICRMPATAPLVARVPAVDKALRLLPWMTDSAEGQLGTPSGVVLHAEAGTLLQTTVVASHLPAFAAWGPFLYFVHHGRLVQVRPRLKATPD